METGMDIEAVGRVWYTVHLTDEDVEKIKKYLKEREDDLPSSDMKKNICWAVGQLAGDIDFYSDDKVTERDFMTEEIKWSEFEKRTPEEILNE